MKTFKLVRSYSIFQKYYSTLQEGDLVSVRIPLKHEDLGIIVDLITRKVESFPHFLSQILSFSKILQAQILKEFIPPFTFVIKNKTTLLEAIEKFLKNNIKEVITKEDRANCGLGVKLWNSIEEVFNFAGTEILPYPFVLQPFFKDWKDYRVIILGNMYIEAYERRNSFNFRQNLFFGGEAIPYKINEKELDFCRKVMERGKFPYAHIDMVYIDGEGPYLSEISLKGGIKGAKITSKEYELIIHRIEEEFINKWKKGKKVVILKE